MYDYEITINGYTITGTATSPTEAALAARRAAIEWRAQWGGRVEAATITPRPRFLLPVWARAQAHA